MILTTERFFLGATKLSRTTLGNAPNNAVIMAFRNTTLSIMTLSKTSLRKNKTQFNGTQHNDLQNNDAQHAKTISISAQKIA